MNTIIKAQRGINAPNRVLIYNRDRSIYQELNDEQPLLTALGDRHKCYFKVKIDGEGIMHIIREVNANW